MLIEILMIILNLKMNNNHRKKTIKIINKIKMILKIMKMMKKIISKNNKKIKIKKI